MLHTYRHRRRSLEISLFETCAENGIHSLSFRRSQCGKRLRMALFALPCGTSKQDTNNARLMDCAFSCIDTSVVNRNQKSFEKHAYPSHIKSHVPSHHALSTLIRIPKPRLTRQTQRASPYHRIAIIHMCAIRHSKFTRTSKPYTTTRITTRIRYVRRILFIIL